MFLRYMLPAETLCLGERIRNGIFRPCSPVFSYTTLAGALTEVLEPAGPIHAAARFLSPVDGSNREILTFAPRDGVSGVSTIPLQVEYLVGVVADLFILKSDAVRQLPKAFSFSMGGATLQGFRPLYRRAYWRAPRRQPSPRQALRAAAGPAGN
jgi:hypothetical protein